MNVSVMRMRPTPKTNVRKILLKKNNAEKRNVKIAKITINVFHTAVFVVRAILGFLGC
jgi:hypothetical protein